MRLFTRRIAKWLLKLFFRVKVNGKYAQGLTGSENKLIIANHSSVLDGMLLALFLPDNPVFLVHKESADNRLFRWFLSYVDYLVVDPNHPMAIKKVINLINSGQSVVIFPEGRVTTTGTLMKVYAGAAFVAMHTQSTIIPVQISGAKYSYFSRLSGLFNLRLFPKMKLTILPPTKLTVDNNLPDKERREEAKDKMHQLMMEMMLAARERKTLYNMLLDASNNHGKNTLAYEDGITDDLTYGDLVKKSVALSVLFRKENLSDRVGILLPNSNACMLAFYALQHHGKTPTMINYTAGFRGIDAGLVATQVKTIITSKQFIQKAELEELINQLGTYEIIYLEDLRKKVTTKDKLSIVIKRAFPGLTSAKRRSEEEAVVLFTSGSEGLPKGVVHSHDSLLTNVAQGTALYDINPQDKFMVCLPTFHVFGLTIGALLPIDCGAAAYLYPNPLHYRVIPELVYSSGCTILMGTSTFLSGYARYAEQYDFHSLRYVVAGAEKLSAEVMKTYHEKFGIRVMEGYGTTETAPVIAGNSMMACRQGSVGRLLPGVEAKLVPVPGIESDEFPVGRLVVRADNVMMGYLRADNPDFIELSPVIGGKREYDTGDIVEIDDKGYLTIRGRAKRFAKIAGEMIALDSVEAMTVAASPEHQHAVIHIEHAKKGEALVLFTTDEALTRKQLQKTAKSTGMTELSVPKDIRMIEEVPVFRSGKTNYPELSELAATETQKKTRIKKKS